MKLSIIIIILTVIPSFIFSNGTLEYENLDQAVNELYNFTVDTIQPVELENAMKNRIIYILDTRSEKEFSVSSIKDSRYINYKRFKLQDVEDIPKNAEIIVYCTIGFRSEKIGEKLIKSGYSNVKNLYGGIIKWVNDDHNIYSDNNKTLKLHTYSPGWAKYLNNDIIEVIK